MSQKMIKVQQTGSPIRRDSSQRLHLKCLGLGKMNRIRVLKDTPTVRGLIKKVAHMVKVLEN